MMGEKSPPGHGGQGTERVTGKNLSTADCHDNILRLKPQVEPFDVALSLSLDAAVIAADSHNLAAIDHWLAARHHAHEATQHADQRDEQLRRICWLESRLPPEDNDERHDD